MGDIGSHLDLTSGRRGHQAICRKRGDFPETTLVEQEITQQLPARRKIALNPAGFQRLRPGSCSL
jgi:hypothetical protein